MTHYWDQLQREVNVAAKRHEGASMEARTQAFVVEVVAIEGRAVCAVSAVVMLDGFPSDLGFKIVRAIDKATTIESMQYRLTTLSSELIGDLHSIFHEVATRKIQTPFGVLSDDPEGTLRRLDGNGKDAFEDHIAECADCEALAALGTEKFCSAGETIQKQWTEAHKLMTEGVPASEYPT